MEDEDLRCLFTDKETSSKEHVVPQWLQHRFKLQDQKVYLPNGTRVKYKHLCVPAESLANSKFGEIENRISCGQLNRDELYLWALKLHIGFIYRDSSLRFDIKNPQSQFILDVNDFEQEVRLFRELYSNWAGGGTTAPSPFGSVFVVDSLNPTPQFDFMHCLITGTVGINIGNKFVLVFLWDQGEAANRAKYLDHWAVFCQRVKAMCGTEDFASHCYMATHVWACEAAYWAYRHRRSFSVLKTSNKIAAIPPIEQVTTRPSQKQEYGRVCRSFGLDLVHYAGEVNNVYRPFTP